jgi:hypothetical protein
MKKIILISFAVLLTVTLVAQTQEENVTIKKSELTAQQLATVEANAQLQKAQAQIDELNKKVETYGKWVGVGGEVGTAVKEGLSAVVDVADKFGKTDVGKFTMVMIAWKVIGQDVVRIFLGLLFFITFTTVLIYIVRKALMSSRKIVENPGFLRYPKKYEIIRPAIEGEEAAWTTIVIVAAFLISIWITYAIMF